MSTIEVVNHVTLDGVMQGPGHPDEDRRGGFEHGGWATRYFDEVQGEYLGARMSSGGGALLFGRWTYEKFADVWPKRPDDDPIRQVLTKSTKYVASRTLQEPLEWENSVVLGGNAVEAVAELKARSDNLVILGSGELIRSLLPHGLIDAFVLTIHPLVLGSGRRLFGDDATLAEFRLVESKPTTTGVLITRYELAR